MSVTSATKRRSWLPLRILNRYGDSGAGDWATVISWNALVALIPLILVMATLATLLLGSKQFETYLARELGQLLHKPPIELRNDFDNFRQKSGLLALISLGTMIWTGGSLFSAMDNGLSRIYGAKPRRFVRQKLMAISMIFVFMALIIPLIISSSLLSVHPAHLPQQLPGFVTQPSSTRVWTYALQFLFGLGLATVLCLATYKIVPNRRQKLARVLPGAVSAGVAFEAISLLFPLYFQATQANSTVVAISVLPFLLTYFFLLGQILVFGHLINCELGDQPAKPASVVDVFTPPLGGVPITSD